MAYGGPPQISNLSDTVILVPAGQSFSKEEIVSLLAQIKSRNNAAPQNTLQNVTAQSSSSANIVPLGAESTNASVTSQKPLTAADFIRSAYQDDFNKFVPMSPDSTNSKSNQVSSAVLSNQVLSPISPNILTPDASPMGTPTTPISTGGRAKNRFQHTNSYPTTPKTYAVNSASPDLIGWPNDLLVGAETDVKTKQPEAIKKVNLGGTLVFFDLETTGLGHMIGKCNVQITEISMVAFDRKEFWQSKNCELKDIRIVQKLSMCVRPRSSVSPGAAKITGLDDDNLIDQFPFDQNTATAILSFLSHLPKPVVLLAHNGNTFDFPLLRAELKRLSMSLPPEMMVADTLAAFKSIGIEESPPDRKVCKSVKYGRNGRLSHSLENLHLFFFNKKPAGSHSSEGDCIALAKVCHKLKDEVIPWIDANAKTLDDFQPMW